MLEVQVGFCSKVQPSPSLTNVCGQPQRGVTGASGSPIPKLLTHGFPVLLGVDSYSDSGLPLLPTECQHTGGLRLGGMPALTRPSLVCIWDTLARWALRKGTHGTARASWQGEEFEAIAHTCLFSSSVFKALPATHTNSPPSQNLFL